MARIHDLAERGDIEGIRRELISNPAALNQGDRYQKTPLHLAAYKGKLDMAQLLVQSGANIEAQDGNQSTPLHLAAMGGKLDMAQLLVQSGANIEAQDIYDQNTPLHLAAIYGRLDVAQLLVQSGANIEAQDNGGKSPLDLVSPEIAQLLEAAAAEAASTYVLK